MAKLKRDGTPDLRYRKGEKRVKEDGTPYGVREPKSVKDMGKNKKSIDEVFEKMGIGSQPNKDSDDTAQSTPSILEPTKEEVVNQPEPVVTKREAVLTSEERALADRIASSNDREWEVIREDQMIDYSLDKDPYALPPEAKKLQDEKKYAFRWALSNIGRIDELRSRGVPERWWPVNRNAIPELAKYCDSIHGGLQNKDQLLMFKPYWMHRKHKDAELALAEAKGMAGAIESKDGERHDWGEYRAGEDQKISGSDQVFDEDTGGFSSEAA